MRLSSAIIQSEADWPTCIWLWHHQDVIAVAHILFRLLADLLRLLALSVRRGRSLEAENLFLRRQLALYKERASSPDGSVPPLG